MNVGSVPNTGFGEDVLSLDDDGAIVVDHRMETDVEGIFAAGDVRQDSSLEIAAAIGDGVTAIESAKQYL